VPAPINEEDPASWPALVAARSTVPSITRPSKEVLMATPAYIAVLDPATGNYRARIVVSDGYPA
jgi:hypothetical protein